jgi:hypothetical protein
MVAVKLEGRLGNQLFQYAFIYTAAKKLNTTFYIDSSTESFLLAEYFNIKKDKLLFLDRLLFSIKGYKNFFSYHLRRSFYRAIKKILFLKEVQFSDKTPASKELSKISDGSINMGFFQSEIYFSEFKEDLKKQFTVKEKYRVEYETIKKTLPKDFRYVAVHIRRGDYIDLNLTLPSAYYQKAIERIHSPDNFYIILSDDPAFAEKEFENLHNKYVSVNTDITDLQFLIGADICILSNSSFSWWGAYLNTRHSQIIAPKFWSGNGEKTEYPKDILLNKWSLIES